MKKIIFIILISVLLMLMVGMSILSINKQLTKDKSKTENTIDNINEQENIEKEIFSEHYGKAMGKLETLSQEEKIAQLFVIGMSNNSDLEELKNYQFGGYLFFKDFFFFFSEEQVKQTIDNFQKNADIPLLIAIDEEGGRVVRASSNSKLAKEPFKSPSELYKNGGLEAIKQDTIKKSMFLERLGINLNFAPVVDIATNSEDYMFKRALQEGKELTAEYAKTVISASKGYKVSYTLKHFPGYGSNKDTHTGSSQDERTYEEIYNNDLEPFRAGIEVGAEVVMVSHNLVTSIDENNPASISKEVHNLLREELKFSGIIITDDINMGAIKNEYTVSDSIVKAIQAGNDMIIITIDRNSKDKITNTKIDYKTVIESVKNALEKGEITDNDIDTALHRILAWKYYKGLM